MSEVGPTNIAKRLVAIHGANVPDAALEQAVDDANRKMGTKPGDRHWIDLVAVDNAIEKLTAS